MDLLLAHAYFLHADPAEARIMKPYAPLGILSLSAWLKGQGFDVEVFDSTFLRLEDFGERLRRTRPPVVGIYVNMMTKRSALSMITAARGAGAKVVLGGPEPVHHAAEFLRRGVDVIVVGEGEQALTELIPRLKGGDVHHLHDVRGIVFRGEGGEVVHTPERARLPDLGALPWPDREAIDLGLYQAAWKKAHGYSSLSVITARGCPFTCTWCSHAVYGHSHRRRRPEAVADEIAWLKERYQPDQLWIADDVFTINKNWIFQFRRELAARDLKLPYECISRADKLDPELCGWLADTGCKKLWVGSESGSQRVLDEMKRGVTVEQVRASVGWLRERGIQTGIFIMVGFGDETEADLEATTQHLKQTAPDEFLITVAYPIKGTAYHQALGDRILAPADWEHTTDRDVRFVGRRSDRYWRLATRRVIHEVALHRAVEQRRPIAALDALVRAGAARVGMSLVRELGIHRRPGAAP